jgi:hypothetical protein
MVVMVGMGSGFSGEKVASQDLGCDCDPHHVVIYEIFFAQSGCFCGIKWIRSIRRRHEMREVRLQIRSDCGSIRCLVVVSSALPPFLP